MRSLYLSYNQERLREERDAAIANTAIMATSLSSLLIFLLAVWQVEPSPIGASGRGGDGAISYENKKVWSSLLFYGDNDTTLSFIPKVSFKNLFHAC
jgi:hypothetical protein